MSIGKVLFSNIGDKTIDDTEDTSLSHIAQLDSVPIVPPNEMAADALGIIPELPINEKGVNPFETPKVPGMPEASPSREGGVDRIGSARDSNEHVLSWTDFNSMGNRSAEARLSQPHAAPEGGMWGNMSTKAVNEH